MVEVRGAGEVGRGDWRGGGVIERGVPFPGDDVGDSSGDEGRGEIERSW